MRNNKNNAHKKDVPVIKQQEESSFKAKEDTLENSTLKQDPQVQEEISNSERKGKKSEFMQILIFTLFSISAGVIQILSFECLYHWIGWNNWWATYLISLTLSVIWNFTFNRKFTFKSSNNVPISMSLVLLYYCAFTPISVFGGQALESIGWNGTLVTLLNMVLNFVTEYIFDKYVTFNDRVVNKIAGAFKKKEGEKKDMEK